MLEKRMAGRAFVTTVLFAALLGLAAVHPGVAFAANISIDIVQPALNQLVGSQLRVAASIQSEFELATVRASVGDRESPLTFASSAYCDRFGCHPGWSGVISLSGLPRGPKSVTVIATDVFGASAQVTRAFIFDAEPALTVVEPLDSTVARPGVHVSATCTDDDPQGCASVTVALNGTVVASGVSAIDQTISLEAYEGAEVVLQLRARDSAGQVVTEQRTVYVDSSPRLSLLESVDGQIFDVAPDRILFLDTSGGPILKIRSRATGQDVAVPAIEGGTPQYGFLTPTGAIFVAQGDNVLSAGVYDWRGSGAPIAFGLPNSAASLTVAGNYAIWTGQQSPTYTGEIILFRRDLVPGTTIEVVDHAVGNWRNGVAGNGDVTFWGTSDGYNIYRYRNGITTRLTNDTNLWNTYPITDGINVVYRKHTPCCFEQTYALTMYGESGEVILTPPRTQEPAPGTDYAARGGWIAYTRPGSGPELQIWVRSPQGVNSQLSFFGSSSWIDALSPNGELTFVHGATRYLAAPGREAVQINSRLGQGLWQDGQWLVVIGRSLFAANPDVQPATATTVASSANPALGGQTVILTATVHAATPGGPTPTGSVTFFDGATALGTDMLDASGQASLTTSTLAVGSHSITARYADDGYFSSSTSAALSQIITAADVPVDHSFLTWIGALYAAGITTGCDTAPPMYCPDQTVSRAEMPVFLLRGIHGAQYTPPAATGIFADVAISGGLASWVEQLFVERITTGCDTNPARYCPEQPVSRAEMAVFLLRSKYGAGYQPPAAEGMFADVPLDHPFVRWIEQLAREGITSGCGTGPALYCPDQPVTRGQMAVFLVRAFGLPL
jgi:hypothetical protein